MGRWLDGVLGWTQVVAMLLGIIQIWLVYTTLVMRFVWLPVLRDSVLPFAIGILEFTMIDLLGPETLGLWFYSLAAVFAIATWASHNSFTRARMEPENAEFFRNVEPAGLRDHAPAIGMVSGLAVAGLALQLSGSQGWFAFAMLAGANLTLLAQLEITRHFWAQSMAAGSSPDET